MFLRRLRINNLRGISDLDLQFESTGATSLDALSGSPRQIEGDTRKWTLLLGENGCGKTTVLRAVALVLAGSSALGELLQEPDTWIREGSGECEITVEFSTKKGDHRHASLKFSRGQRLKEIFRRNHTSMDELDRALEHCAAKLHGVRLWSVPPAGCWADASIRIQSVHKLSCSGCRHAVLERRRAQAVRRLGS